MELAIAIVVGLALGAAGFVFGRSGGRTTALGEGRDAGRAEGHRAGAEEARREIEEDLRKLVDAVRRGRAPESAEPGSVAADLTAALAQGWAPRETEREAALREAVGRVSAFLDTQVRSPLAGHGADESADALRHRIESALGALEDLDFFLTEATESRVGTNIAQLLQRVSREFATDHDIGVRVMLASNTIMANAAPAALMDALYLVLHNASRFGDGSTIDLSAEASGGRAVIRIRDRGSGFSEEAFTRAFDPFYSTSDGGLGLGLPHARKVIEEMGGEIELRNVPDGGAEVEISLPSR
jgi:signal transduction histidine kinase